MLSIGLFTQGILTEAHKLDVEDDFGISGSTADQTMKIWINREKTYGMEVYIKQFSNKDNEWEVIRSITYRGKTPEAMINEFLNNSFKSERDLIESIANWKQIGQSGGSKPINKRYVKYAGRRCLVHRNALRRLFIKVSGENILLSKIRGKYASCN